MAFLQTGAKTPKRIPSSGKETALTLSPHRKFCSERRAIFSCFPNENYAKLQTSVSSVPFNSLNTISGQMFLCGIEASVRAEISSFFTQHHSENQSICLHIIQEPVPRSGWMKGPFIHYRICQLSVSVQCHSFNYLKRTENVYQGSKLMKWERCSSFIPILPAFLSNCLSQKLHKWHRTRLQHLS